MLRKTSQLIFCCCCCCTIASTIATFRLYCLTVFTIGHWHCILVCPSKRWFVHLFFWSNIVAMISHERLEKFWWNLQRTFNSPYWWPDWSLEAKFQGQGHSGTWTWDPSVSMLGCQRHLTSRLTDLFLELLQFVPGPRKRTIGMSIEQSSFLHARCCLSCRQLMIPKKWLELRALTPTRASYVLIWYECLKCIPSDDAKVFFIGHSLRLNVQLSNVRPCVVCMYVRFIFSIQPPEPHVHDCLLCLLVLCHCSVQCSTTWTTCTRLYVVSSGSVPL